MLFALCHGMDRREGSQSCNRMLFALLGGAGAALGAGAVAGGSSAGGAPTSPPKPAVSDAPTNFYAEMPEWVRAEKHLNHYKMLVRAKKIWATVTKAVRVTIVTFAQGAH